MRNGSPVEVDAPRSVRASFLDIAIPALAGLGAATPQRCVIRNPGIELDLPAPVVRSRAEALLESLLRDTDALSGKMMFCRAAPLDEGVSPHLSFAGVYKSYRPLRDRPRHEYLVDGLVAVLTGRRNRMADYYYARHGLFTDRPVDVMYSAFVPTMAMHGTGYSHGGRVLVTYCDTPLATWFNDPLRVAASASAPPPGLDGRLVRCIAGLEDVLGVPVDVEFVITRQEKIYVTQVRPISPVHLAAWAELADDTWARALEAGPPSNTLSSIGTREGVVVDLRHRPPRPDDGGPGKVLVVGHVPGEAVTTTLDLLEHALRAGWRDVVLLVDHGDRRHDDHLQYVVAEDPAISWVGHTTTLPDHLPSGPLVVRGDGFRVEIEK